MLRIRKRRAPRLQDIKPRAIPEMVFCDPSSCDLAQRNLAVWKAMYVVSKFSEMPVDGGF